jgi:hypothetical protein
MHSYEAVQDDLNGAEDAFPAARHKLEIPMSNISSFEWIIHRNKVCQTHNET